MDNFKMVVRAVLVVVALVFVLAVAGASADGIQGDNNGGYGFHPYVVNTSFDSFSTIRADWSFDGDFARYSGLRDGFWLKSWDKSDFWTKDDLWIKDNFQPNDSAWCDPNPTSASPEPGTVVLLALGMAALFFMGRRRVFQA
jgi:hypothetical protein